MKNLFVLCNLNLKSLNFIIRYLSILTHSCSLKNIKISFYVRDGKPNEDYKNSSIKVSKYVVASYIIIR